MNELVYEDYKIGDAVKLDYKGSTVYGRYLKNDENSAYYGGLYAVIVLITPHGTIIRVGRAFISKLNEEELPILKNYERLAIEDSVTPYEGKLVQINNEWYREDNLPNLESEPKLILKKEKV